MVRCNSSALWQILDVSEVSVGRILRKSSNKCKVTAPEHSWTLGLTTSQVAGLCCHSQGPLEWTGRTRHKLLLLEPPPHPTPIRSKADLNSVLTEPAATVGFQVWG